ncbi:gamma-glutamylcyclotransferase family protein [Jiella marina]|uniref:gamma-glutamylcyclotransferase family protein n=1 Tax=Jiella sp. LLJ827 TaxID=2917712 RepID=UPI00210075EE|nr:gamma-glutamylcyclotransferase family protein [Jiella sp. LLJ827]MCQ0989080.1 gamma-glutamylcyclotransferase [Jiella sp. LLJ827]
MTEYFAFYGTLMDNVGDPHAPSTAGLVKFLRPCRLAGTLRSHGRYPGFFPAAGDEAEPTGVVRAELYEILTPQAFAIFDGWEEYDPRDEANSLYLRRRVRLYDADLEAWVYVSQQSDADPVVPEGDWRAYQGVR